MLYSISDKINPITTIPYRMDYNRWMRNLSPDDHIAILDELDKMINGTEIQTSSWMPGDDWSGTVFNSIYLACNEDEEQAGLFFGLLVWEAFMRRQDNWSFGHYSLNNVPIRGLTYFKIEI